MAEEQDPEVPDVPEHDLSEEDMMFVSLLYNYRRLLLALLRGLGDHPLQGEAVAALALEPVWLHLLAAVVLETSAFPTGLCLSFSGSSLLHLYLSWVPSLFSTFSRSRYF